MLTLPNSNNAMTILPVTTPAQAVQFIEMAQHIYADWPNWTPVLADDLNAIFDPEKNSLLQQGAAQRWLLFDAKQKCIGRIAAYYNHEKRNDLGLLGFFECIDNQQAANTLFKTALDWLRNAGCATIHGPMNYGEKDRFAGIQASGFDEPNLYLDNYNPPYYPKLWATSGHFTAHEETGLYSVLVDAMPKQALQAAADKITHKLGLTFNSIDLNQDQIVDAVHYLYQQAFRETNRIKHLSRNDILLMFGEIAKRQDPRMGWLAYIGDQPVGWCAYMQDFNQAIRQQAGLPARPYVNVKGMAYGVVPEHQGQGIGLALANQFTDFLLSQPEPYRICFCGINAISANMLKLAKTMGCQKTGHHIIYTAT